MYVVQHPCLGNELSGVQVPEAAKLNQFQLAHTHTQISGMILHTFAVDSWTKKMESYDQEFPKFRSSKYLYRFMKDFSQHIRNSDA